MKSLKDRCARIIQTPGFVLSLDLLTVAAAWILYRYWDIIAAHIPECLYYRFFGVYCAGCGATRFITNFVHGRYLSALSNNLFMALILTYLLLCIIALNISAFTKHRIYGRFINLRVILILALTAAAFAAIRNIPVFPFTRLAP